MNIHQAEQRRKDMDGITVTPLNQNKHTSFSLIFGHGFSLNENEVKEVIQRKFKVVSIKKLAYSHYSVIIESMGHIGEGSVTNLFSNLGFRTDVY